MAERKKPASKNRDVVKNGSSKRASVEKTISRPEKNREAGNIAAPQAEKMARKTERMNVWLRPDQVAWLKTKKNGSETMRSLVAEAMSMDALARSVRAGRTKK